MQTDPSVKRILMRQHHIYLQKDFQCRCSGNLVGEGFKHTNAKSLQNSHSLPHMRIVQRFCEERRDLHYQRLSSKMIENRRRGIPRETSTVQQFCKYITSPLTEIHRLMMQDSTLLLSQRMKRAQNDSLYIYASSAISRPLITQIIVRRTQNSRACVHIINW